MAHTLETWTFKPKTKYPWHLWCNGAVWKLDVLLDYTDADRMIDACRYQAQRRNLAFQVDRVSDGLVIQFQKQYISEPIELGTQQVEFTDEDKAQMSAALESREEELQP